MENNENKFLAPESDRVKELREKELSQVSGGAPLAPLAPETAEPDDPTSLLLNTTAGKIKRRKIDG